MDLDQKIINKIDYLDLKVKLLTKAVQKLINVSGFGHSKPATIAEIEAAVSYGKAAIRGIDREDIICSKKYSKK